MQIDAQPQTKARIYLADDEENIRTLMTAFLSQSGYEATSFADAQSLLDAYDKSVPDLVILDIMMPGLDGLSALSVLRKKNPNLPIIIVSAKDTSYDRIAGLTLGSDDYLVKPFLPLELVARVGALLRRTKRGVVSGVKAENNPKTFSFGSLEMCPDRRDAFLDGKPFALTPAEFDFLLYLIEHQDKAVPREELLRKIWGIDWNAETRAADDLVKRLRRKLRAADSAVHVETVWGYGFRLSLDGKLSAQRGADNSESEVR